VRPPASAQQTLTAKARATAIIDRGNRLLRLDPVPRGPAGEALDPDNASVVEILDSYQKVRRGERRGQTNPNRSLTADPTPPRRKS
jgi:hypothetical protein